MDLYRHDAHRYSVVIDAEMERYGVSRPTLSLHIFPVLKETPCGYWISDLACRRRWVSKTSHKRYAWPTPEEARESFRQRKIQQIRILSARIECAREDLALLRPNRRSSETLPSDW